MSSSNTMPVEIYYAILDEVIPQDCLSNGTRADVLSCSRVSHTFRSYLLPTLFRDAPCWSSKCIRTLHELLIANPHLATCIRTLALIRGGKGSKWSRDVNWVAKDSAIQPVLSLLSNTIEEFTLETSAECGHLAWAGIRDPIRASLSALVSSASLKTLIIKQFEVSRDIIRRISSSVEGLTLEGVRVRPSGSDDVTPPRSPSKLQTLTLWYSPLAVDVLIHSFRDHGFPLLHTIGVKDRGLLDGDLTGAMRLVPLAPNLRKLRTDSKIFFKDSPVRVKSTTQTFPFTSLILSCPYDPSFSSMIKTINRWLSASLNLDALPPPTGLATPPPGSPSIPSALPSNLSPPSPTLSVNILSHPPRSALKSLTLEFDSANPHVTEKDTPTRLYGQMSGLEADLQILKTLLDHPEYESVQDVNLNFSLFGLADDQGQSMQRFILSRLQGDNERNDSAKARKPRFTFTY